MSYRLDAPDLPGPTTTRAEATAFITGPTISASTLAMTNGHMRLAPWFIPRGGMTVDRFDFEVVSVAGSAGSVVRVVVYLDSGDFWPRTLYHDPGSGVASTSIAVTSYTPSSSVFLPGGVVWVAAVPQGAPVTSPTLRSRTNPSGYVIRDTSNSNMLSTPSVGYLVTGITGTPTSSLSLASLSVSGNTPIVVGRVA